VNEETLQETVVVDDQDVDEDIRHIVLDEESFRPQVTACLTLFQPIAGATSKMEEDNALLSDVPKVFHELSNEILAAFQSGSLPHKYKRKKREIFKKKEFSCKPVHSVANLPDPRYKGKHSSKDETLTAIDLINEICSHLHLCREIANVAE